MTAFARSRRPPPPLPARAAVKLNANRHVTGVLRGFDQFMNLVLDNTVDEKLKADLGMVVSFGRLGPSRLLCRSSRRERSVGVGRRSRLGATATCVGSGAYCCRRLLRCC